MPRPTPRPTPAPAPPRHARPLGRRPPARDQPARPVRRRRPRPAAYQWVDALAAAGQSWVAGAAAQPAGQGRLALPGLLRLRRQPAPGQPRAAGQGRLAQAVGNRRPRPAARPVDYAAAAALKAGLLARAFERFTARAAKPLLAEFGRFRRAQADWLDDYALYMALRDAHHDQPWLTWDAKLVRRDHPPPWPTPAGPSPSESTATRSTSSCSPGSGSSSRRTPPAAACGRSATSPSSSAATRPTSGPPPDFSCSTASATRPSSPASPRLLLQDRPTVGQPALQLEGDGRPRLRLVGRPPADPAPANRPVRIDHFRGFAACWNVPASEPTAVHGKWVKAPGQALMTTLRRELGSLPFIAEDLGVITPDVEALRDGFGLPGMRVLQFGFGGGPENAFLPHNHARNAVVYTGTPRQRHHRRLVRRPGQEAAEAGHRLRPRPGRRPGRRAHPPGLAIRRRPGRHPRPRRPAARHRGPHEHPRHVRPATGPGGWPTAGQTTTAGPNSASGRPPTAAAPPVPDPPRATTPPLMPARHVPWGRLAQPTYGPAVGTPLVTHPTPT